MIASDILTLLFNFGPKKQRRLYRRLRVRRNFYVRKVKAGLKPLVWPVIRLADLLIEGFHDIIDPESSTKKGVKKFLFGLNGILLGLDLARQPASLEFKVLMSLIFYVVASLIQPNEWTDDEDGNWYPGFRRGFLGMLAVFIFSTAFQVIASIF